jgi:hypothetical protein
MKPIKEAAKLYEGTQKEFTIDLSNYLAKGYVYSGDDAFIMAKPIESDNIDRWNDHSFDHKDPDCWFVYLAAGKGRLQRFQQLAPFKLPLIAWHRRGKEKAVIYDWDRFLRKADKDGLS